MSCLVLFYYYMCLPNLKIMNVKDNWSLLAICCPIDCVKIIIFSVCVSQRCYYLIAGRAHSRGSHPKVCSGGMSPVAPREETSSHWLAKRRDLHLWRKFFTGIWAVICSSIFHQLPPVELFWTDVCLCSRSEQTFLFVWRWMVIVYACPCSEKLAISWLGVSNFIPFTLVASAQVLIIVKKDV